MKKLITKISLLFILCLAFTACKDNDPQIVNEEELITTVNVTLTPATGPAVVLTFVDLDGPDGPGAPVITGGTLAANTEYTGSIELLNETETPAEDITEEVEEEDDEHQFFYTITNPGATVAYADLDGNGNPVGLAFTLTTGTAGPGNFTVSLLHEPDKTAPNVSAGDPTNAGGEEDIAATFPITVQ